MVIVRTSLSRTFLHDGQIGLSLIARSTLSSNKAISRQPSGFRKTNPELMAVAKFWAPGLLVYSRNRMGL
jgi:hypothetical protein